MGDPERCDAALLPPYEQFGLGQPEWRCSNYFHIRGRYQLLVDNLMDLTHLPLRASSHPRGRFHGEDSHGR